METPQIPFDEQERLKELYKYELLDSGYEEEFTEVVQLASRICNTPISLITLIDTDRQWFKAVTGLEGTETTRNASFCAHAILNDTLFEVTDTKEDLRFYDNPYVIGDPYVRYYAGMPLITSNGYKLGTLCVIDRVPRAVDEEQALALQILGKQVIKLFELRIKRRELERVTNVQQKMMAIMAHDVRGPLASIRASYDLKLHGLLSEDEMNRVDESIPPQLDNTLNLLNNIVEWGKLQLSDPAKKETFLLFEVCEQCFAHLSFTAAAKENKLANEIEPGLVMNGNRAGVEFVLRNLLGNANKFTASGVIKVSAGKIADRVELSVADNGIGMSNTAQDALLNSLWLPATLGTHNEKGSGMGLKLICEYLQTIGGSLKLESQPGKGTRIRVVLI